MNHKKYLFKIRKTAHLIIQESITNFGNKTYSDIESHIERMFEKASWMNHHNWILAHATEFNLDYGSKDCDAINQYSENKNAIIDIFGTDAIGYIVKQRGLTGLIEEMAFYAFFMDVEIQCRKEIEYCLASSTIPVMPK